MSSTGNALYGGAFSPPPLLLLLLLLPLPRLLVFVGVCVRVFPSKFLGFGEKRERDIYKKFLSKNIPIVFLKNSEESKCCALQQKTPPPSPHLARAPKNESSMQDWTRRCEVDSLPYAAFDPSAAAVVFFDTCLRGKICAQWDGTWKNGGGRALGARSIGETGNTDDRH